MNDILKNKEEFGIVKDIINDAKSVVEVITELSIMDKILGKINSLIGRNYITQIELKQYLLSGDIVELWGTKLDGSSLHRIFEKNLDGPNGRAMRGCRYWDEPYNYMILWSNTDGDFRTIVLKNVQRVKIDGRIYKVR